MGRQFLSSLLVVLSSGAGLKGRSRSRKSSVYVSEAGEEMHLLPEFGCLLRRVRTMVYWLTVLLNCRIHRGMFAIDGVEGLTLAPVYWNASNPM